MRSDYQTLPVGVRRLSRRLALPEIVFLGNHPVYRSVNLWVFNRHSYPPSSARSSSTVSSAVGTASSRSSGIGSPLFTERP